MKTQSGLPKEGGENGPSREEGGWIPVSAAGIKSLG
jgi:hypothetical protein